MRNFRARDDRAARRSRRLLYVVCVGMLCLGAACGSSDEEDPEPPPPKPPEFGAPSMTCEDLEDDDVGKVITKVEVRVTDPKRDLVTEKGALCGTLDGLPIALTDDDADRVFTWEPSGEATGGPCSGEIAFPKNRMICQGDFALKVTAEDAKGNVTELDEVLSKDSSS